MFIGLILCFYLLCILHLNNVASNFVMQYHKIHTRPSGLKAESSPSPSVSCSVSPELVLLSTSILPPMWRMHSETLPLLVSAMSECPLLSRSVRNRNNLRREKDSLFCCGRHIFLTVFIGSYHHRVLLTSFVLCRVIYLPRIIWRHAYLGLARQERRQSAW